MPTRLFALAVAAVAAVALVNIAAAADEGTKPSQPNVLVIMSDEHNASVLGCYGNKVVRTPNMDRLAAQGIRFDAAYTNSPLCVPSRLSFTAGKYVSRISIWNNDCELPKADYPSIAAAMNTAGYEAYLCGKMHYERTRRYGFKDIAHVSNGGTKSGRGQRRAADNLTVKDKNAGGSGRFKDFHAGDESSVMRHDRAVTANAVKFFENRKPGDKPFFLLAGYLAPHFPLIVPEKYVAPYRGKVSMPVVPPGYIDALPLNYKHLRVGFNMTEVPPEIVRSGRELYYGLTSWVDSEIGKVLAALDKSGLAENTVIIYTADHGENLGEHGLWWKNCVYDTAARVPLIVSWPKRWQGGQLRTGACSLVDVVQTIAALGGAHMPADCDGDSLCAYMDRPETKWKDLAVSEYWAHHIASGYAMIRMGSYKYVYHTPADAKHPAFRELYDLKADPGELTNLAARPEQAERISTMHAALVKQLRDDPDKIELRCREEIARGYPGAEPKARKQSADAGDDEAKAGKGEGRRGKGAGNRPRAAANSPSN